MGRPRKPTELHIAQGTYNATRHKKAALAPSLPVAQPARKPPAALPKDVLGEWEAVSIWLSSVGIIFDKDVHLLEQGFIALHNARAAQKEIEKIQVKSRKSDEDYARWTAMTRIRSQEMGTHNQIMARFAVGPSDYAKLIAIIPKPKEEGRKSILDIAKGRK